MREGQGEDTPVAGNLPLELDAFVGRTAELTGLAEALAGTRLVTVTGVGGVGKSRLAARAAARSAPPDGVWRVELAPVRDPAFVDHAVVAALGLTDHTTRPPRETLLDLSLIHARPSSTGSPTVNSCCSWTGSSIWWSPARSW